MDVIVNSKIHYNFLTKCVPKIIKKISEFDLDSSIMKHLSFFREPYDGRLNILQVLRGTIKRHIENEIYWLGDSVTEKHMCGIPYESFPVSCEVNVDINEENVTHNSFISEGLVSDKKFDLFWIYNDSKVKLSEISNVILNQEKTGDIEQTLLQGKYLLDDISDPAQRCGASMMYSLFKYSFEEIYNFEKGE